MPAKTNAERQADYRQRMREKGIVEVIVKVPKGKVEAIKKIARDWIKEI